MTSAEQLRADQIPFLEPIGSVVGEGWYHRVSSLGDSWVMRRLKRPWNLIKGLNESVVKDYQLNHKYLGPFVPFTGFVIGMNDAGKKELFAPSRRIVNPRPLRDFSYEELVGNEGVIEQLEDLSIRVERMYQETGRVPDLHGYTLTLGHNFDAKHTPNIVIDENNRVYLLDTDMIGSSWLPEASRRLYSQNVMRSFRQFTGQLNSDPTKIIEEISQLENRERVEIDTSNFHYLMGMGAMIVGYVKAALENTNQPAQTGLGIALTYLVTCRLLELSSLIPRSKINTLTKILKGKQSSSDPLDT